MSGIFYQVVTRLYEFFHAIKKRLHNLFYAEQSEHKFSTYDNVMSIYFKLRSIIMYSIL